MKIPRYEIGTVGYRLARWRNIKGGGGDGRIGGDYTLDGFFYREFFHLGGYIFGTINFFFCLSLFWACLGIVIET